MSAGESLGDAYVNVRAETEQLGAGLSRAYAMTTNATANMSRAFTGSIMGIAAPLAGLVGVAMSVRGAFSSMMGAIEEGGQLYDLKQSTGVAVKDLVVLKQAFANAGASAGMVPKAIAQMQRGLASGKFGETFAKLGVDMGAIKKMSPAQQFEAIGKALGQIKDPAERTNIAMKMFGRSGYMLKGLFADPNAIKDAREGLGSLPDIMARNAKAFDEFGDAMSMFKAKVTGFWAGIVSGILPAIKGASKFMATFDVAAIGQKIGVLIAALVDAFKEGKLGEVVWLSLKVGFLEAINFIVKMGKFLSDAFLQAFGTLSVHLTSLDFWKGVGKIILGSLMGIGAGLMKIFETPLNYLEAGISWILDKLWAAVAKMPKWGKQLFPGGYTARSYSDILADTEKNGIFSQNRKDSAKMAQDLIGSGVADIGKTPSTDFLKGIMDSFKKTMSEPGLFSSAEAKEKLAAIMNPLIARAQEAIIKTDEASVEAEAGGGSDTEKMKTEIFGFSDWWKKAQEGASAKKAEEAAITTSVFTKKIEQNTKDLLKAFGGVTRPLLWE